MKAVLTGIDTHPANSLALVLESIGYDVWRQATEWTDDKRDKLKKYLNEYKKQ